MIKMLRVDHRLLHGQVAFSWTSALSADCILIANDEVISNDLKKTTIKLAKPSGVKLVIKSIEDSIIALNKGVTDKYKLFIVVESIDDAYRIIEGYPQIEKLNIGGTLPGKEKQNISKTIAVTSEEKEKLKKLILKGVDVSIQLVPTDSKIDVKSIV